MVNASICYYLFTKRMHFHTDPYLLLLQLGAATELSLLLLLTLLLGLIESVAKDVIVKALLGSTTLVVVSPGSCHVLLVPFGSTKVVIKGPGPGNGANQLEMG